MKARALSAAKTIVPNVETPVVNGSTHTLRSMATSPCRISCQLNQFRNGLPPLASEPHDSSRRSDSSRELGRSLRVFDEQHIPQCGG